MRYFAKLPCLWTVRGRSSVVHHSSLFGLAVLTLVFTSLCAPLSRAQVSASVSGTITDPSSAAVSAASVTINNLDTGVSRTVPTDQSGRYRFFALPVGPYEVRVTKLGFAEGIRSGIRLLVGQDATLDMGLRVGE